MATSYLEIWSLKNIFSCNCSIFSYIFKRIKPYEKLSKPVISRYLKRGLTVSDFFENVYQMKLAQEENRKPSRCLRFASRFPWLPNHI